MGRSDKRERKSVKAPIPADPTPMTADKGKRLSVSMIDDVLMHANRTLPDSSAGIGVGSAGIGAFKAFLLLLALTSCTVGPDYKKPPVETPAAFKEAGPWVKARPADSAPKGKWWEAFNDPVLDGLMEQVSVSNQSLKAAEARYRQASAAVQSARAQLFPTLGENASATRSRSTGPADAGRRYNLSLNASWEPDFWGRVR